MPAPAAPHGAPFALAGLAQARLAAPDPQARFQHRSSRKMETVAFMRLPVLFGAVLTPLSAVSGSFAGLQKFAAFFLALAPQSGFRHYLKMQYADQTFRGLYHWNFFDLLLLIPYFAVMIVLSIYGVHRYTLCYLYRKYRKNYDPHPPQQFPDLPRVTVQLPIFNEQFVIDRLLEAICAMEYPREKLEIQVLDDSTDETTQVASALVDRYAALGHPIVYIH